MQTLTETVGIQEMQRRVEKAEANKDIMLSIKEMLDSNYFDYEQANIYGTGELQREQRIPRIANEDAVVLANSIRNVPLREFLAKSGTTGIAGAAYLIPTKVHSTLYEPAAVEDITDKISISVLPPDQLPGTTCKVDIIKGDEYKVWTSSSGATMNTETLSTTQATLDFSQVHGINFRIGRDLIEDAQWDLVENHIRIAGKECGKKASDLAMDVLITATDGDGTKNTEAAGANTTLMLDVINALNANMQDGYLSDSYVLSKHVWLDALMSDKTYASYAPIWADSVIKTGDGGTQLFGMNLIFNECPALSESRATGVAYEDLDSVVFKKDSSLLSGRKRWLRIENYSDPVKDLVGATVTFRQDSVSIYNDSVCLITET
jgi:hypothetical protein